MAINHNFFYTNLSVANMIRKLVACLVSTEPKTGRMWESVWTDDTNPADEFPSANKAWIISKNIKNGNTTEKMYAKILFLPSAKKVQALVSSRYDSAKDQNNLPVLSGSIKNNGESDNSKIAVRNNAGHLVAPSAALIPSVIFPNTFNVMTDRLAKVWVVRKLDPLFDQVLLSKLTDIFAWVTMCSQEVDGADPLKPLEKMGYYHHFGFGWAGEQFLPDASTAGGCGLYTCATSNADSGSNDTTGMHIWAGGGVYPPTGSTNIGCVFCAGKFSQNMATDPGAGVQDEIVQTWFYANHAYGLGRSPFDQDQFGFSGNDGSDPHNVGFDYTELCKYSPYSGVRILTPAYIYGMYDNLYRILGRIPVFYTSLEGLYAGDIVSQDLSGEIRDYILFPFITYKCLQETEAKRGHAIFVPQPDA